MKQNLTVANTLLFSHNKKTCLGGGGAGRGRRVGGKGQPGRGLCQGGSLAVGRGAGECGMELSGEDDPQPEEIDVEGGEERRCAG
jgi:hypothetical protein